MNAPDFSDSEGLPITRRHLDYALLSSKPRAGKSRLVMQVLLDQDLAFRFQIDSVLPGCDGLRSLFEHRNSDTASRTHT